MKSAAARAFSTSGPPSPLGLTGARDELWTAAESDRTGDDPRRWPTRARELAARHRRLPLAARLPRGLRDRGGFDAVVGNPPWDEVTVEELAFYARYQPGLTRPAGGTERDAASSCSRQQRPELAERMRYERERAATLQALLRRGHRICRTGGDPDLYKFFCQRYRKRACAAAGPSPSCFRGAFSAKGSADFRRWLLRASRPS